jgi:hypothetical protein
MGFSAGQAQEKAKEISSLPEQAIWCMTEPETVNKKKTLLLMILYTRIVFD